MTRHDLLSFTMLKRTSGSCRGFTLVEIMIIVAIIAILAAAAIPNVLRARKRSQAMRILEDLRVIDGAVDQYGIETSKSGGSSVEWADVQPYFKDNTVLATSGGLDLLGGAYNNTSTFSVDSIPKLSTSTFNKLSDVVPSDFWSPFYP
jgi:prepilin-type N-terminal cleavage/methylation domain-containing protein